MNLNEYGEVYTPLASEPQISTETSTGGSAGGFFGDISGALKSFSDRFMSRPATTGDGVSSQIYQAIYAFGSGKLDAARESAARALLKSRTGGAYVAEVERQRLMDRLPVILIGGVILFGAVFLLARR